MSIFIITAVYAAGGVLLYSSKRPAIQARRDTAVVVCYISDIDVCVCSSHDDGKNSCNLYPAFFVKILLIINT